MIELLFYTGARVSEFVQLRVEDLRAVAQTGDAFGKSRGWLKKLRDASDKLRVATIAPRVDHRSTYQRSSEREE